MSNHRYVVRSPGILRHLIVHYHMNLVCSRCGRLIESGQEIVTHPVCCNSKNGRDRSLKAYHATCYDALFLDV